MKFFNIEEPESLHLPQEFHPCMIVVQARMQSTRLPGKVVKKILGRPMLSYQLERLRHIKGSVGIVVATTIDPQDDVIAELCDMESVHCFRGSEDDVLSRIYAAATSFGLEVIIRSTADCPLIDPKIVESGLSLFFSHFDELDYLSNTLHRTFPRGMDVEIMRYSALEQAYHKAETTAQKEHVTPYIYQHPEQFHLGNFFQTNNASHLRLTCDTGDDFTLISKLIEYLVPKKPLFTYQDIIDVLDLHPEWVKINAHIAQKTID